MRKSLIFTIRLYQKYLSPDQGLIRRLILGRNKPTCIFHPTCSEYAIQAIQNHGSLKGSQLALIRIAKCNPFGEPRVDLVPEAKENKTK